MNQQSDPQQSGHILSLPVLATKQHSLFFFFFYFASSALTLSVRGETGRKCIIVEAITTATKDLRRRHEEGKRPRPWVLYTPSLPIRRKTERRTETASGQFDWTLAQ